MGIAISVDLRSRFGAVRNQGGRPTCIAFAASDTHSFARGSTDHLSVEYAYYHAVQRKKPANPNQGVSVPLIVKAIKDDGQPLEHVWPYVPTLPTPLSTWVPPKNSEPVYRHEILVKTGAVSTIITALDSGQPALLAARVTEQFQRPPADYIIRSLVPDRDSGNHALIAVGHGLAGADAVILVRNSWGPRWADGGYAWVMSGYLSNRLIAVATPF